MVEQEKKVKKCGCGNTKNPDGNCDGSHKKIKEIKEEVNQQIPEVLTKTVNVESISDLDYLLLEMGNIDKDQSENPDKMFALDVTFNGKPSNPYFTLCKFIKELNEKVDDLNFNLLNKN
tara:strand:- start:302 stop:658 length:357 start_codon:yes stop_codon:yes gene_type:complete